jgi:hypothetical protein
VRDIAEGSEMVKVVMAVQEEEQGLNEISSRPKSFPPVEVF